MSRSARQIAASLAVVVLAVPALCGLAPQATASAPTGTSKVSGSAPPAQPVLYPKSSEKPPRLYGYVHSSPNVQVTITVLVEKNATVKQNHRFVRRGMTGPRGHFSLNIRFRFKVSHPMPVNITLVARDPQSGLTTQNLLPPLLLFPPHDRRIFMAGYTHGP